MDLEAELDAFINRLIREWAKGGFHFSAERWQLAGEELERLLEIVRIGNNRKRLIRSLNREI